ncbi:MAG: acetylornithine/succinylornithine family transaminase [Deinococcales bacterium]
MSSQTLSRSQEILARDAKHNAGLWSPSIVFTHGQGVKIYDADGNEYLDCMAGIAVASVGHGNDHLAEALAKQAKRLIICSQAHGNDVRADFYDKLMQFLPAELGLTRIFMANSGSEVNEAATKWAKAATGRKHFIAAKRGFSGRTHGVLPLTWEKKYREPFGPYENSTTFISYNNIAELEEAVSDQTAAIFLEPVQGEGGMYPVETEFLLAARRIADKHGALLIMDEVQSGVGRTGKFLAIEHHGVRPDMVTLAKGLGGGVPLGVLLMSEEVALKMPKGGHGTTFGGNALASAAGLAVLEEIERLDLINHAWEVGNYFQERLRGMGSSKIRTVRGLGLMIGVEMKSKVAPYISALKDKGVIVINAGATVIRLVPPLIITKAEVDEVVKRLAEVLNQDLDEQE